MAISSDDIKVFLAVVDKGSFSVAARSLGRVPSAVSMSIGLLEAELDLQLFDRSGREARPTEYARSLEPKARQIVGQVRLFETHALSLHQGLETLLSIVVAPELLALEWSGALTRLSERYPTLAIDILSAPQDDALAMLHEGKASLAIIFERPRLDERELFAEIGSETFVGVISAKAPSLRFTESDLFATRQIIVGGRERVTDARFVLSHDVWYTDSQQAALKMVLEGLGWAYLPNSLVRTMIDDAVLSEIVFAEFNNQVRLWVDVVWRKHSPLGMGALAFIDLLRNDAGQQTPNTKSKPCTTRKKGR
jgi:Transcriptional regulator